MGVSALQSLHQTQSMISFLTLSSTWFHRVSAAPVSVGIGTVFSSFVKCLSKRRSFNNNKQSITYSAPRKECSQCDLRTQCTKNKSSRSIMRHLRQEELDHMRAISKPAESIRDLKARQHRAERSLTRAKRYGYDRSRWQGLRGNPVQEYMMAAIQNIEELMRHARGPGKAAMAGSLIDS